MGSLKQKEPPAIKGTGYVIDCLEAALWAFHKTDSFKKASLLAVNLGNDADTTGAVLGQIAGAYYGKDAIPSSWLQKLAKKELICELAEKLYHAAIAH
jgi:ADP-ribosyl-[dinitrogen reductase] hydrolase